MLLGRGQLHRGWKGWRGVCTGVLVGVGWTCSTSSPMRVHTCSGPEEKGRRCSEPPCSTVHTFPHPVEGPGLTLEAPTWKPLGAWMMSALLLCHGLRISGRAQLESSLSQAEPYARPGSSEAGDVAAAPTATRLPKGGGKTGLQGWFLGFLPAPLLSSPLQMLVLFLLGLF